MDPTDGLPVQRYRYQDVTILQDISPADEQQTTHSDDYPYPELPLPSFFHQLPPHSQVRTGIL